MKQEVKVLWEICFDDTPEFVDLYFNRRYKDDINMAIYEEGKLISALQMVPYFMTYFDKQISVSYISGACTHPDFRSKGVMKKLLDDTHRKMYTNGIQLSTLIPAENYLFSYYGRTGYIPAFFCSKEKMNREDLTSLPGVCIEKAEVYSDIYPYFNRKMQERNFCIQHTAEDFLTIVEDLRLSKGELFIARKNKEIIGIAFCTFENDCLYVIDSLVDSDAIRDSLFKEIATVNHVRQIEFSYPSDNRNCPKGMLRVINAQEILQLYACRHKETCLLIELTDDAVSQNNGTYLLKDGLCTRTSLCCYPLDVKLFSMNIVQFADWFTQSDNFYMSLMLD